MLLLKGFFRKKSTIVYLIIYTIIMTTIIFSFFLIKHNEKIINDITKKRSYITMTSSKDYYNEIDNIKNVIGIERIILFEPDNDCNTFKHQSYQIFNLDGTYIEYTNDEPKINWEDFSESSNSIIYILPDKEHKLKDNEIALSKSGLEYVDSVILDNLIGQNVSFIYNNEKFEFTIKCFYDSKNKEMSISENKFYELLPNSFYSYKIYIDDYSKESETVQQLESINDKENIEVDRFHIYDGIDNENASRDLINIFEIVSFFAIIMFVFVFIIVSKNILSDEKKNIQIERMLGYNKTQLRKYITVKILVLVLIALFISIIISKIINILFLK